MNLCTYLFLFEDDTLFDAESCPSVKYAILRSAEYNEGNTSVLKKALLGFNEDDILGMIELYNKLCFVKIKKIYKIDVVIYGN